MTMAAYLKISRWMGRAFGAVSVTGGSDRRVAAEAPAPLLVPDVHVRRTLEPEERVLALLARSPADGRPNDVR